MKSRYNSSFLEGVHVEDKIQGIQEWATENDNFDTTFVDDLERKLEEYGSLSVGQEDALDSIIRQWKIPSKHFA